MAKPNTMNHPNPLREFDLNLTRRQLFGRSALGLGAAAMAQLFGEELMGATAGPAPAHGGLHHHTL